MRAFNPDRVIFYGRHDLAAGIFKERIVALLSGYHAPVVESVNDAIEAFQCKITVDELPGLFADRDFDSIRANSSKYFARASRFINLAMKQTCIEEIFEGVEEQYRHLFWQFLEKSGASKRLQDGDLTSIIKKYPSCVSDLLETKSIVKAHGSEIRQALLENPQVCAEPIIHGLATTSGTEKGITLPTELTSDDIDSIMRSYLNSKSPNPNYVAVLASWPTSTTDRYRPSIGTVVLAQKAKEAGLKSLFSEGSTLSLNTKICIDREQEACKGLRVCDFDITYVFSEKWLEQYMDYPTILNNCIYLFDFVDDRGILTMPTRAHDEITLFESFGTHIKGEYRTTFAFHMRNTLALAETIGYAAFLKQHGVRFEAAIEWVYNRYFEEEIGIKGFSLYLPTEEATWLDKCKAIGPEIERAIKAYDIYAKYGEIDDAYFPREEFKYFQSLPSLTENKYVVASAQFEKQGYLLFSGQSPLRYTEDRNDGDQSFFDLLRHHDITRSDYSRSLHPTVDWLISKCLITEDTRTGLLKPTNETYLMRLIWESGAIPLKLCSVDDKELIEQLVQSDVLAYQNTLFAPEEAAYLNYVFNDASFPNSLGLRNRYSHANATIKDPNADEMKIDYYQMLAILIAITIKINEELKDRTGMGGPCDFIDWPMYDIPFFKLRKLWGYAARRKTSEVNSSPLIQSLDRDGLKASLFIMHAL